MIHNALKHRGLERLMVFWKTMGENLHYAPMSRLANL